MNLKQNKINNIDCLQIKGVFVSMHEVIDVRRHLPSQDVQKEDHFALKQHFAIKC